MNITKIFASLLLLCIAYTGNCSLPSFCTLSGYNTLSFAAYSVADEDIESGDLADCFNVFGRENIVELYMSGSGNYFTYLPDDVFQGMDNLEILTIGSDGLAELPDGLFEGLGSIKLIELHENYELTLQDGNLDGLDSLEELWIADGNLETLPEGVFQGLTSLVTLYLHGNNFRTLPEDVFEGLSSLELLDLSYNELTELPLGIFSDLASLLELRVDDNFLLCYPQSFAREIDADEGDSECEGGFTSGFTSGAYVIGHDILSIWGFALASVFLMIALAF